MSSNQTKFGFQERAKRSKFYHPDGIAMYSMINVDNPKKDHITAQLDHDRLIHIMKRDANVHRVRDDSHRKSYFYRAMNGPKKVRDPKLHFLKSKSKIKMEQHLAAEHLKRGLKRKESDRKHYAEAVAKFEPPKKHKVLDIEYVGRPVDVKDVYVKKFNHPANRLKYFKELFENQ